MPYWMNKVGCWEIKKCHKKEKCPILFNTALPCWAIKNVPCKESMGKNQCYQCDVYKKYGKNRPIIEYF